jgi:hemerythrin-like domain-containing protein
MKITDRLKVEHGVFLLQLRYLEELLRRHAPPATLVAAVETIAIAEENHSLIEDRVLYPALASTLGRELPALKQIEEDHQLTRELVARIRAGETDEATVQAWVDRLRSHMEREIHATFALIEETFAAERLVTMCNWEVEHIYGEMGKREAWVEKWLG